MCLAFFFTGLTESSHAISFFSCSKKVSKSLESDFSNKLNQLLLTVLQKQRQQRMMDDFGGYYDERMYWRQNDEIHDADKEASAPCSLAPVSHLGAHQQESWQHSSFGSQHHDNQNLLVSEMLFNVSCGKLYSYYILYLRKWKSG
jgi:protein neuralized